MKKIWLVTVYDCYGGNNWLPDYTRAFACKEDAKKHAEELRTKDNPMPCKVVVNPVNYVEEE